MSTNMSADANPNAQLATFAAQLKASDIPGPVLDKAEDLLVDWFGSAVAGHGSRPVSAVVNFAQSQGPTEGPAEILTTRRSLARG
jgi:2-methylcitrate dehydratase PrpD